MANSGMNVPMSDLMRRMTVNVTITGLTVARWRLWMGTHIIRLAVRVIGCGLKIELTSREV